MPVFEETSRASRELRNLPTIAQPLPRLTPRPQPRGRHAQTASSAPSSSSNGTSDDLERYEVVVIGAGPAGLFLTLNLARLGLTDDSLACFDAKPAALKAGQADGLQPRTLEVLRSLGLHSEILDEGCHMSEVAFWNPSQATGKSGIERTTFVPDVAVRARFQHEVTIHQGRIERILEENLGLYSQRGIVRNTRFVGYTLDDSEGGGVDAEFPITVTLEQRPEGSSSSDWDSAEVTTKKVRTKYLVGADGAHSRVRKAMGLRLEGESQDHVWGVCDFVADTDFPDIRKRSAVHSEAGSLMVIPREQTVTGDYLTRLYVQIKDEVSPEDKSVMAEDEEKEADELRKKRKYQEKRQKVTLNYIFEQANRVFAPYSIKVREDTEVDWYAAYQIGQRMTEAFTKQDKQGAERIFIVGDACHTHSPKAGQGMNVSMMDSYNLAWKLVHTIHGLAPEGASDGPGSAAASPHPVLATFSLERLAVAKQLIEFDTKFSSMFSGAIGASDDDEAVSSLTHDQFLQVFRDGNGFTSGCGIEYLESTVVQPVVASQEAPQGCARSPINPDGDVLNGCLRPGRRLADAVVRRFADANPRHLQDDFLSTGRYRILFFSSTDIHDLQGRTAKALAHIGDTIIPAFPKSMIQLTVLHPSRTQRFEWTDVPKQIKQHAEMRFHGVGVGEEDVYGVYGVDEKLGAAVVVRPDGYVGAVAGLDDTQALEAYLRRCLRTL
ncbi:FAD binding domain-containing protein [Microdochium trichocladiopsis]|uniref:FAD binding domain-containing protein n=1 Tax=Microdochium trichocladiopsis TaxID=1682393 RepID=A0A9P9BPP6_9PEZI|nr:FAD binding domain-containing protein [Microdochium trichocladiopsis]KAH7029457.1 FAD binding domain-containing protein [Microdochium trichocladiopsis]